MRDRNYAAIQQYRNDKQCSIQYAIAWDDYNRAKEALDRALTVDDLKPIIKFILVDIKQQEQGK